MINYLAIKIEATMHLSYVCVLLQSTQLKVQVGFQTTLLDTGNVPSFAKIVLLIRPFIAIRWYAINYIKCKSEIYSLATIIHATAI